MSYLPPEECLFFLITRSSLSVTNLFKRILSESGLPEVKPSYLGALICLWSNEALDEMLSKLGSEDGMKLTELGHCAGVEPSTITGLIDRMERDGLVYRASVPNDRRAQKANLTEKGREIRSKVLNAMEDMETKAFAGIGAAEIEGLKKALRIVLDNANRLK